ncbi:segregation and condensation protein A [Cellulomonas dongxiuzhuiae]|uniref:Segregation and condensation protein A n=1 Tax=Cellulomonas dongxiuzhuiae TaxID=2819979 RepID=A0ABX8GFN7_9CELL|nr:ScpA family protein [Cellulomonas dongxiuzhuiae]MBO3087102.1 segregation/condensation protein A [Cellulomonas dongxiuzhuiae]MBO3093524.1 segregation/condensation protein A [Cellulomonas dongxiuzhuiae]QWC14653.1 segregation/condensation protein A [Cellulomonas dongxiuzhuiae]
MATPPDGGPDATTGRGTPGEGAPGESAPAGSSGFEVHLDVFSGPFDLLLGLIAKHKLDITEIALAQVTDEFIAHIRAGERAAALGGKDWDLSQASEFLLVAATLLDLKAARLLPSAQVEDAEDLELLEARDLLFARLLQYRAYKVVAADLGAQLEAGARRHGRNVELEPHLAALLPELVWQMGPEQLAVLAARALAPKAPPPGVDISHLHAPLVSVREQAAVLVDRLRRDGATTFRALTADATEPVVVVVRFLALLELFREGAVSFDQVEPLGELTVRWTGTDDGEIAVSDDFDREDATGPLPVEDVAAPAELEAGP